VLTSTIPSEIGLLTQLELLSFFNNSLTSTIPSEILRLTQLTSLT
jgi:Leucine-rich repeat (LRR) protein